MQNAVAAGSGNVRGQRRGQGRRNQGRKQRGRNKQHQEWGGRARGPCKVGPRMDRPGLPDWSEVPARAAAGAGLVTYSIEEMVALSKSPSVPNLPVPGPEGALPIYDRVPVILKPRNQNARDRGTPSKPEWSMDFSEEVDFFGSPQGGSGGDFQKLRADFENERRRRNQDRKRNAAKNPPPGLAPAPAPAPAPAQPQMPALLQQMFASAKANGGTLMSGAPTVRAADPGASAAAGSGSGGSSLSLAELEAQLQGSTAGASGTTAQPAQPAQQRPQQPQQPQHPQQPQQQQQQQQRRRQQQPNYAMPQQQAAAHYHMQQQYMQQMQHAQRMHQMQHAQMMQQRQPMPPQQQSYGMPMGNVPSYMPFQVPHPSMLPSMPGPYMPSQGHKQQQQQQQQQQPYYGNNSQMQGYGYGY